MSSSSSGEVRSTIQRGCDDLAASPIAEMNAAWRAINTDRIASLLGQLLEEVGVIQQQISAASDATLTVAHTANAVGHKFMEATAGSENAQAADTVLGCDRLQSHGYALNETAAIASRTAARISLKIDELAVGIGTVKGLAAAGNDMSQQLAEAHTGVINSAQTFIETI